MGYADTMLEQSRQGIDRQSQGAETSAAWNYYSQFGGTGIETPGLKMALYNIGRQKRQATDNLGAWYSVTKKQEDLQDKWQKMWEDEQRRQDEEAGKTDWGSIIGGIVGGAGGLLLSGGNPAAAAAGYGVGSGIGSQF
jgi:hypothetical protein